MRAQIKCSNILFLASILLLLFVPKSAISESQIVIDLDRSVHEISGEVLLAGSPSDNVGDYLITVKVLSKNSIDGAIDKVRNFS